MDISTPLYIKPAYCTHAVVPCLVHFLYDFRLKTVVFHQCCTYCNRPCIYCQIECLYISLYCINHVRPVLIAVDISKTNTDSYILFALLFQKMTRHPSQVGFNSRYWLHCHSNFMFSTTKIENLKWQFSGVINFITFGKFVTSLVQKLKILGEWTDF